MSSGSCESCHPEGAEERRSHRPRGPHSSRPRASLGEIQRTSRKREKNLMFLMARGQGFVSTMIQQVFMKYTTSEIRGRLVIIEKQRPDLFSTRVGRTTRSNKRASDSRPYPPAHLQSFVSLVFWVTLADSKEFLSFLDFQACISFPPLLISFMCEILIEVH